MIRINRGEMPEILKSEKVNLSIERLKQFYTKGDREQKRYNFPFDKEILGELKPIMHERFNGKCGYCEINIPSPEYGAIDRFRPHNGVRDNKQYFKNLYWWLAYDWNNLIYCCRECNQYKANYFPLKDNSNRAEPLDGNIEAEDVLLLNPCDDNPSEHISYKKGKLIGLTGKGEQTIQLLRLNREKLVAKRQKEEAYLLEILVRIDESSHGISPLEIDEINKVFDGNEPNEFLFTKQQVLFNELKVNPYIKRFIDAENRDNIISSIAMIANENKKRLIETKNFISNTYFPIEYIEIKNFKNISELRLDFPKDISKNENWLFLLGENGVGKTSFLQALAIGLKTTYKSGDPIISKLVRKGKHKSIITIKERNSENVINTILTRRGNTIETFGNFNSFLIGYSSFRLMQQEGFLPEKAKEVRYKNLFEPSKSLRDVISWLNSVYDKEPQKFELIATSILKLLPTEVENRKLIKQNHNIVFSDKPEIELAEYSEGYKAVIALALDIMITLSDENSDMDKLTGIVLIDEIGNQLHPRWQMKIVKKLREVFPKIQFIVTSHSPLCLRGIKNGEVILLKEDDKGNVIADTNLPSPEEYSVEQLLKSDFFGLHSTSDEDDIDDYQEYYNLVLNKLKLTNEETDRYNLLKVKFKPKESHLGSSLREEIAFDIMDEMLAKHYYDNQNKLNRDQLKTKTLELVKQAWKNLE